MKYYELDPSESKFQTLSIQTTYKCQQHCANCYLGSMLNDDSIPDIDPIRFEEAIKKLPARTDIRFIGAEPTMNPNLVELIKLTRKSGHRPSLLTNGLKLKKESYVKELKNAGLRFLGISMNGGLENDVYKEFDNGPYARAKSIALKNILKNRLLPHINMIIDPTNIHVIQPLIDYTIKCAEENNIKLHRTKFPIMIRLKSIGQMGYYRKTYTYSLEEMREIVESMGWKLICKNPNLHSKKRSLPYEFETSAGTMMGKITDWSVDDDGVPDAGSTRRGILTDDYKVAPFFEYYKKTQEEKYG